MAKDSKVSMGGRQKSNVAHEQKRQAKFAANREAGKVYQYQPNPYKQGTQEYLDEEHKRAEKRADKKLPLARWTSIMTKLDNEVKSKKEQEKVRKGNKKTTA